jgi:hypothetical protein
MGKVGADNTATTADGIDDEEIQELVYLIDELNHHSDLTAKLANQSKI